MTPRSGTQSVDGVPVEREIVRRIEYVLTRFEEEEALAPGDNLRRATFLVAVITGTSVAKALPFEPTRPPDDAETLRIAVNWVFDEIRTARTVNDSSA